MLVRLVEDSDAELLSRYYSENRDHFKLWEPLRPEGFHSLSSWNVMLHEYIKNQESGTNAYFVAFDENCEKIVAHCNLSQIYYGPFQACYLGFGVALSHQGHGLMHSTCLKVIDHAFCVLGLHRVMANYMPCNHRSESLLK